jgi:hypothetical protein
MIKETLLKQYDRCYNKNGWFVAVRNAVDGVTAEQAAWKPEGSDNSIWESLAHITYYNNAYLQRFKGIEFRIRRRQQRRNLPRRRTDRASLAGRGRKIRRRNDRTAFADRASRRVKIFRNSSDPSASDLD